MGGEGRQQPRVRLRTDTDEEPKTKKLKLAGTDMESTESMRAEQPECLDSEGVVHRVEFVRLLQQALTELGHCDISDQLQHATDIQCESEAIVSLKKHVLAGEWPQACASVARCAELAESQRKGVQFALLREHALEVRSNYHLAAVLPRLCFGAVRTQRFRHGTKAHAVCS